MSHSTKEQIKWYDENGVRCDPGGRRYLVKYDPFRTNELRFTALGPCGRLGDVATKAAAISLIRKDQAYGNASKIMDATPEELGQAAAKGATLTTSPQEDGNIPVGHEDDWETY